MLNNKKNEINFHDTRYKDGKDTRVAFEKFYLVTINSQNYFKQLISNKCQKKAASKFNLLDYGCGIDAHGLLGTKKGTLEPERIYDFYSKLNVNFTGIDISPEAIKIAKKNSIVNKLPSQYFIMDAEKTDFPNETFDVIIGKGILHHLTFERCIPEIGRLLNKNGSGIFFEPLGHNPIINLGRFLTPNSRTKDEHPLLVRDKIVFEKYFETVNFHYFCCFSLIAFLFYKLPQFKKILAFFTKADELIFNNFPFFKKYSWIVVVELNKPKKSLNK